MTAAGDRHMARVRELGCILCGAPASIHHINAHGMGMKASDFEVLPLCFQHHQAGGMGVAVHAGKRTWEAIHGTERELLEWVRLRLAMEPRGPHP